MVWFVFSDASLPKVERVESLEEGTSAMSVGAVLSSMGGERSRDESNEPDVAHWRKCFSNGDMGVWACGVDRGGMAIVVSDDPSRVELSILQ